MTVINLGRSRELVTRLDEIRREMLARGAVAFTIGVMHQDGSQTNHTAGAFQDDPQSAMQAVMGMLWELQDPPRAGKLVPAASRQQQRSRQ